MGERYRWSREGHVRPGQALDALPDAAATPLGRAIGRLGRPGFEAALDGRLRACLVRDDVVMLGFARAGPARGLYWRAFRPGVCAHLEASYLTGAYLLDPFQELSMRRVPAGVYRSRDVAPGQFVRTCYHRDCHRRTAIIDEFDVIPCPTDCSGRPA
jgi:hypothetical protein